MKVRPTQREADVITDTAWKLHSIMCAHNIVETGYETEEVEPLVSGMATICIAIEERGKDESVSTCSDQDGN